MRRPATAADWRRAIHAEFERCDGTGYVFPSLLAFARWVAAMVALGMFPKRGSYRDGD